MNKVHRQRASARQNKGVTPAELASLCQRMYVQILDVNECHYE